MGFFKGFFKGFRQFGHNFTWVTNFILLLIVYVVGIGPVSLVAKLLGKHFLYMGGSKKSTWEKKTEKEPSKESTYRTF